MFLSPEDQTANLDVFITGQLESRIPKGADHLQEKLALQELAACMGDDPDAILPRLVDLALRLTGAVSGGLSLHESVPSPGVFRWHHLRGKLEPFNGATTPRHYSPCGITLDQRGPVLVQHPERLYDWLVEANVGLPEVLLVPLYIGGETPLGTLWVVSEETGHFDGDDARLLTELASFVDIALRMTQADQNLRASLDRQALITREMNHRVQNLFAVVNSLVRSSKKGAETVEQMFDALSGRLLALNSAHNLVRGAFVDDHIVSPNSDLSTLIHVIVEPHLTPESAGSLVSINGPTIECGQRSTTALALLFHELTTNAAKYGALAVDEGRIEVSWQTEGDRVSLKWVEVGPAANAPEKVGFGTTLVKNTVVSQLQGTLDYDWRPTGLVVTIDLPANALSD